MQGGIAIGLEPQPRLHLAPLLAESRANFLIHDDNISYIHEVRGASSVQLTCGVKLEP